MMMKMIGSVFELFTTCNEIFKILNYFIEEKSLSGIYIDIFGPSFFDVGI